MAVIRSKSIDDSIDEYYKNKEGKELKEIPIYRDFSGEANSVDFKEPTGAVTSKLQNYFDDTTDGTTSKGTGTGKGKGKGTGKGTAGAADTTAAKRSAIQQAIDSLGSEEEVAMSNINNKRDSTLGSYDAEKTANEKDYSTQSTTNRQNLQKGKQSSLMAGAQARKGLLATLSSLGAGNGTGAVLANKAVADSVKSDLGGATDTYATNASSLDSAIGKFRDEDALRREQLESDVETNRRASKGKILAKKQGFLQDMAEAFATAGNNANASKYLGEAGDLNDAIARSGAEAASPIASKMARYEAPSMSSYQSGAGDSTVAIDSSNRSTKPAIARLYQDKKRKEEL